MNHKTDMQADLKRIASELRAYNPAADEYKGEHIHKVWAREIEAALSGQSAGVPTGYALVPIEPTVEMIAALGFAGDADIAIGHARAFKETVDAYASMIAAAPAPVCQPAGVPDDIAEGLEILDNFIASVRENGNYSTEATLTFIGQARQCFAAAPAPVSAPSPDREQVGEALGLSYQSCALLLNVLWHHQGGSSTVGQPIRNMLGIGQYDHLTEEQLSEAKRIEGMLAWHEAPDALPFRECGEKKPAGPADQAIYQAIADNYTRESAELGRPLSDFERVVLEYIAFNDGFINTRIRARQMLDGVGGERQGAALSDDARECLQDVVSHYGNFVEALTCKRDTVTTKTDREYWQHELSANARMKRQAEHALAASAPTLGEPVPLRDIRMLAGYAEGSKSPRMVNAFRRVMRWLDDAPAVAQPQAAEPKGVTDAQYEALLAFAARIEEADEKPISISKDAAKLLRTLLAKGE